MSDKPQKGTGEVMWREREKEREKGGKEKKGGKKTTTLSPHSQAWH